MRNLLCAVMACALLSIWPATGSAQEQRFDWSRADDAAVISWVTGTAAWHSLTPYDIGRLAGRMQKGGDAAGPAMRTIITYVLKLNRTALNEYTCDNLLSLSRAICGGLTADEKVRWRGMLQELFNDRLVRMKWREAGVSADALIASGDETGNKLVAEWAVRSANLAELGTTDLQGVVARLRTAGERAGEGRAAVIDLVERKFLADKQSAIAAGHVGLGNLIPPIAGELAQDRRDLWAGRIESYFVDVPTNRQFVTGVLTALGHEKAARDLNRKWVEGFTNWQEMSPEALKWLLSGLTAGKDQARAARLRIVEHIESRYLADAKAAAAVDIDLWASYVQFVGQDISAESRGKWAAVIQQAHASNPEPAAAGRLAAALKGLGATDASNQARIKWVLESQEWKNYRPDGLVLLARELSAMDEPASKQARALLAEHVKAQIASGSNMVHELGPTQVGILVSALVDQIRQQDRMAWIAAVRKAFADDQAWLKDAAHSQCRTIGGVLKALGDPAADRLEAQWVLGSEQWHTIGWYHWVQLCNRLSEMGETGKAARGAVVKSLATVYLADAARSREVSLSGWHSTVNALLKDIPAEQRPEWIARLRSVFAGSQSSLDLMKHRDVGILVATLKLLGDAKAEDVWPLWVETSTVWTDTDASGIASLGGVLSKQAAAGAAARVKLIDHLNRQYLTDIAKVRSSSMGFWSNLANQLVEDMTTESKILWASRLQEAFANYSPPGDTMTQSQLLWTLRQLQSR